MAIKPTAETSPLSQDKREKILVAAKARFLHYGVPKTTMRDIADDLSIAVSNLYLYFENKREIVLAIAENCRAEHDAVAKEVISDQTMTPEQKFEQLLVNKFRIMQQFRDQSPKGRELIAYLLQEFPERAVTWQENLESMISTILELGNQSGDFHVKDVPYTARMMRIALAQFFQPAHVVLPAEPTETDLIQVLHFILPILK
jgi:AcrR family transcriptional regulator